MPKVDPLATSFTGWWILTLALVIIEIISMLVKLVKQRDYPKDMEGAATPAAIAC